MTLWLSYICKNFGFIILELVSNQGHDFTFAGYGMIHFFFLPQRLFCVQLEFPHILFLCFCESFSV